MAKAKKGAVKPEPAPPAKMGRKAGASPQAKFLAEHGYITAAHASRLLKNEVLTIYRWITDGTIKGACIGERKYVKVQSLIDHVGPELASIFGLHAYLPKTTTSEGSDDEED